MSVVLHPRTIATLEELANAKFFARVGVHDVGAARVLPSWEEAVASCTSGGWEELQLEAANRYAERVVERSRERFKLWNDVVEAVKIVTVPLVTRKVEAVARTHALPPSVELAVQWDITHVGIEAEYADVFPPGFFASQAYWYVRGHFPCGWEGVFPSGRQVVY